MSKVIRFKTGVALTAYASVVGKKEKQGPLGNCFDVSSDDDYFGCKTWEKAETQMQLSCVEKLLEKRKMPQEQISVALGGDLCNQITGTNYTMRKIGCPFIGLYGACSTMAESMTVGACLVASGLRENALCLASSHFCTAERQFRTPLDYGGKRSPTAQWTVTGCGTVLLEPAGKDAFVTAVSFGSVVDYDIKDVNNMGAAMAPAAAKTILDFLQETSGKPSDYDMIFTGDLGYTGSVLLKQICQKQGVELANHMDCGMLIFDREAQHVQSGASGCGCSAAVLTGHILPSFAAKKFKKVLFIATGALMSPTTSMQSESIPSIAHLVEISSEK